MSTDNNELDDLKRKADEARARLAAMLPTDGVEPRPERVTGRSTLPTAPPTAQPRRTAPTSTDRTVGSTPAAVEQTLKSTERQRLAHPLDGLEEKHIIPASEIYTPPTPEPTPPTALPTVQPKISDIVASVNSEFEKTTKEQKTERKNSDKSRITYAWYLKAAVVAALVFFGMSLYMNGGELSQLYTNSETATVASVTNGKTATCNYVFTKDKIDFSFVAPNDCSYKEGDEVQIWLNDSYTDFTTANPATEKLKHYGTIAFSGVLLLGSLVWVLIARRRVKRTTVLN